MIISFSIHTPALVCYFSKVPCHVILIVLPDVRHNRSDFRQLFIASFIEWSSFNWPRNKKMDIAQVNIMICVFRCWERITDPSFSFLFFYNRFLLLGLDEDWGEKLGSGTELFCYRVERNRKRHNVSQCNFWGFEVFEKSVICDSTTPEKNTESRHANDSCLYLLLHQMFQRKFPPESL